METGEWYVEMNGRMCDVVSGVWLVDGDIDCERWPLVSGGGMAVRSPGAKVLVLRCFILLL